MIPARHVTEQPESDASDWERDRIAWNLPRQPTVDPSRERIPEATWSWRRPATTAARQAP